MHSGKLIPAQRCVLSSRHRGNDKQVRPFRRQEGELFRIAARPLLGLAEPHVRGHSEGQLSAPIVE